MTKKFPCPYCKGQGGEKDVILDDGTGPFYPCGICKGEGMIEIGSRNHRFITWIREGGYESFNEEAASPRAKAGTP